MPDRPAPAATKANESATSVRSERAPTPETDFELGEDVPHAEHVDALRHAPIPGGNTPPPPRSLSGRHVVALQRAAGNRAVSRDLRRQPGPPPPAPTTDSRLGELETGLATEKLKGERLAKKVTAQGHLSVFEEKVKGRVKGWEIAIRNLGSAYATAAKFHTDAVEAKKKIDAIQSQVMFSVLTVASAGTLAWISGAAQAAKVAKGAGNEGALLTNVLEDVLQNSAAEVLSANGPGLHQRVPTPDQSAVSAEPLVFQNERLIRLNKSELAAIAKFEEFKQAFVSAPEKEWDNYNEAKQLAGYAAWLAKADLLGSEAGLPTSEAMARELERGFWAKWAPGLKSSYIPSAERITGRNKADITYISPSTPVEKRLDAVGITADSGVQDFGIWTSDAEIEKLIVWANGYQVKPFL